MKKGVILLLIVLFANNSVAKVNCDTLSIKGYIVVKVRKAELKKYYAAQRFRKTRKVALIDMGLTLNFHPNLYHKSINKLFTFLESYVEKESYILPSFRTANILKEYCGGVDSTNYRLNLKEVFKSKLWHVAKQKDICYKIFMVTAPAAKLTTQNTVYNKETLGINRIKDANVAYLDVFVILNPTTFIEL